jgi:hypothetical protein
LIAIAKDWKEMMHYNALTFFVFDQQYGIYFIDDWIKLQEGKSVVTANR